MLLSSSTEKVARKALKGEALWKVLQKIDEVYPLKIGYTVIEEKKYDRVELKRITEESVILHTKFHAFELTHCDPYSLARVLVREHNVYSCLKNIKNPDDLWSSGFFFYWFLKSSSSNNKSRALSASSHPLFGMIT